MTHFCPSCGCNLTPDKPVERDGWKLTPTEVYRGEQRMALTPCEAGFLYTLAAAGQRIVPRDVVGARISCSVDPGNLANVMAFRLRKKAVAPFETIRGQGYRWVA